MIKYYKKISVFKVKETWFTYKYNFWDIFSFNVFLHLKDFNQKRIPGLQRNSYTLELNLQQDINEIFSNFSKQIRQQVKISDNEGTCCFFNEDTDKFVNFFNDFASKKNTFLINKDHIRALGNFIKISFAENNGQILAAHSYLIDEELSIVRHLHSATKRLDVQFDKNLIGRANKYLTVKDIMHFKEKGFKTYDFGGYAKDTEDESLKGINNYKLLFGGKIVPCIDYYSYNYWVLKKISKFLGLTGKL